MSSKDIFGVISRSGLLTCEDYACQYKVTYYGRN